MSWAPDYAEVADAREYLRIDDSADDAQIALALTAASRAVDQATGRQFGQTDAAEERTYTARWDRRRCRWTVKIDDLMDDTGVEVWTDAGEVDVFALKPGNAPQAGRPWTLLVVDPTSTVQPDDTEDGVTITGALWGWDAVPAAVKQATLLQAARFLARRDSPYGIAGSPEQGNELRLLARVDPDVAVILRPYVRAWGAR